MVHTEPLTDAQLVARTLAGGTREFEALVERYHGACLRFARHLLGEPADAEDAVQETFVRAYEGLKGYHERDAFRSWLFQILVNRCRTSAARRQRRDQRFVRGDGADTVGVAGDAPVLDVSRRLQRALQGLDAAHREAFLLRVGEELDYDTIARLTGAGVSALKMRVKRAREHVRARWEIGSHD